MRILVATDESLSDSGYVPTLLKEVTHDLLQNSHVIQTIERDLFSQNQIRHSKTGDVKIRRSFSKIKSIIDSFEPEIVYISSKGNVAKKSAKYCYKQGIPFITSHWDEDFHRSRLKLHRHAKLVLTPSVRFLTRLSLSDIHHTALWGRSVSDKFTKIKRSNPAGKPFITWVGRVEETSGVYEFLDAFLPYTHKVICGKGSLFGRLQSEFRFVDFVDHNTDEDLLDVLKMSSVCVCDSITTQDEINMIKAIACGVPVATKPTLLSSELITPGLNGYISLTLRKAIMRSSYLDPKMVSTTTHTLTYKKLSDDFTGFCDYYKIAD